MKWKRDIVGKRFDQHELHDFARDLGLSKKAKYLIFAKIC